MFYKPPPPTVRESAPSTQKTINKLAICSPQHLQIGIEVTLSLLGCIYEPQVMVISERTKNQFSFAKTNALSVSALYASRIMAPLDRPHPRALFDIHHLFNNDRLTNQYRIVLIIYLINHDYSLDSLLSPTLKDISQIFTRCFVCMTDDEKIISCTFP